MKRRPDFSEGLVQSSAEDIRPSALEPSELPTNDFQRLIPIEVKDGAARERNLNGGTYNLHELTLLLRRRTTPAKAQVRPPHFTIPKLQIDRRLRCGSLILQKQRWNVPE